MDGTRTKQVLEEKLEETLGQLEAAREAMRHLYTVELEELNLRDHAIAQHGEDADSWYQPEDDDAPFFTEACLYPMLGKEDARTVLALVRSVGRALGMDERGLQ